MPPGDYHTMVSKSDRERQISYDITYMQTLKKWYEWTYLKTETDSQRLRERIHNYWGEWWEGGVDWEFGIDMYTLLHLK